MRITIEEIEKTQEEEIIVRCHQTSEALLRREVDVLKNLSHPYIPHVYDFFVDGETVYTVMDYIQGESLDRPLKRGEHYSQAQVI